LIGVAPSFTILVLLLTLGGLGSALFHPPAASIAVRVTEGGASGLRYSVFSFGGALGYAAGPVVAVSIVATFGLDRLWLAMLPMLLLVPVLIRILPAVDGKVMTAAPSLSSILRLLRGPLGLVFGISALSTFVQRVFLTMEPIAANAAGASEAVGALTLSVYLAGQAGGSLMGGWLTDRIDRRRLIMGLTMASMPLHAMAILLEAGSPGAFTAAFFAGSASMALLPPVVVIAQEIMPGGAALGSGIVMGLAWAAGSLGVLPAGVLGDVVGARYAALLCTPVVLGATMLAMSPSLDPHRRPNR
jgi:FSR family fosmidomycin resistance protein-like MFS transporter